MTEIAMTCGDQNLGLGSATFISAISLIQIIPTASLTPIEIIGVVQRPFVLMIRLFANIAAGHIVILSFVCLIFVFGGSSDAGGWGFAPVSMAFALFMNAMELLVAFLQAYVFTLLTAMYFGACVEEPHHAEQH